MGASQLIANRFAISDLEQDLLGRGGMGSVYRATDTQTSALVSVKVLDPRFTPRASDIVERFLREGQALRQLNHPNIVKMVAAVEEDGQHYLVLEYVEGGSLRDVLADQGRLPSSRVIEIALDLADALTRAHRLSIIHRDLKPANVLLAEDGTPRLTDFGIARVSDSPRLTETGILVGTVDYLSPEACNDESLDERADIWAFGVLLFEMLSGERPFQGENLTAKLTAILTQPVPDLVALCPNAPEALVDLIYRMLEKDRQQRIPSVRLVGAELEAIWKGRETPLARLAPEESRFAPPTPPAGVPRHNLPAPSTPFVGREAELAELTRLLADPAVRLLTILGLGGMGKTRLALEASAAQLERFEHGVFFARLAPLNSADNIVPALAEALDFSFRQKDRPKQELLDYLERKTMLLLMDGYEHLLNGTGLVSEVLRTAPGVKILVTSRARLNVHGEHLFHLTGMDCPTCEIPAGAAAAELCQQALESSAIQLFLQSARRARPGFELAVDDLPHVTRICHLVGGTPLGIQLAAAWVEMLSLPEIAAEIGQGFDFLETDLHDVPDRQRSIRAVFDHSWSLLTPRERAVMWALSAFRGGFTREAARQVAEASLRELMALVNKSLLQRAVAGATALGTGSRYEVHEFLRQYAAEKLAATPDSYNAAHDRHCVHYASFLQRHEPELTSASATEALVAIRGELANVRAAWEWAVAQAKLEEIECGLGGLSRFYLLSGPFQEGEALIGAAVERVRALPRPGSAPQQREQVVLSKLLAAQAVLLNERGRYEQAIVVAQDVITNAQAGQVVGPEAAGHLQWGRALWFQGNFRAAQPQFERALELARQGRTSSTDIGERVQAVDPLRPLEMESLKNLGNVFAQLGDYTRARAYYDQSLRISRELGDRLGESGALNNLGLVSERLSDYAAAQAYFEQALQLCREVGDRGGEGRGLKNLGLISLRQSEYGKARVYYEQGLLISRELGHLLSESICLHSLGSICSDLGEHAEAWSYLERALRISCEIGNRRGEALAVHTLGNVSAQLGDYADAKDYMERALALCRESGDRQGEGYSLHQLGAIAAYQGNTAGAEAYFKRALHIGREIGERLLESDALGGLGTVSSHRGDYARASVYHEQSLHIYREISSRKNEAIALNGLGLARTYQGDRAEARAHFEQALDIGREVGARPIEGQVLSNLALVYAQQGEYQAAREFAQQALDIAQEFGERRLEASALSRLGRTLSGMGHLAEAAEAYRRSLSLRQELGEGHLALESLAGLASVALALDDLPQASTYVAQILGFLESTPPDGTDEPLRVYLTCYRVLQATQDPSAWEVLDTAHRLLQKQAADIENEKTRRSYLENLVVHQEIAREWKAYQNQNGRGS
jgi:predicted ATPase